MHANSIRIVTIRGSVRPGNYTGKALNLLLAKKPIALLGVAAGQIGAIKALEHLRSVCSHVGAIVLPGPVSVAGVQGQFDDDGNCLDPGVEKRIRGLATTLTDYIRSSLCPRIALEQMVRESASASTQGFSSE